MSLPYMFTMGLFLEVLFPKMDTRLQLGSHWQLVAWHNCLSYFSYYSPTNTAKNTLLARASQSWLTFSTGSCMSPDLSDLTHHVQDSWHWFLPLACPQQEQELCWAHCSCLIWNLQMRPHSEIVPKHLKRKSCSNRALKEMCTVTRNFSFC